MTEIISAWINGVGSDPSAVPNVTPTRLWTYGTGRHVPLWYITDLSGSIISCREPPVVEIRGLSWGEGRMRCGHPLLSRGRLG